LCSDDDNVNRKDSEDYNKSDDFDDYQSLDEQILDALKIIVRCGERYFLESSEFSEEHESIPNDKYRRLSLAHHCIIKQMIRHVN